MGSCTIPPMPARRSAPPAERALSDLGADAGTGAVYAASSAPGLPGGRRLGAHLPLGHGMVRAAERARAIGADCLQIFSDNPTAWRRRAGLPDELPAFRAKVAELGLDPLAVHAAYLVNLASPDRALFEQSLGVLSRELEVAPGYGARFVNVHAGSHRGAGTEAGIARVAEGVSRALAESSAAGTPMLVIENSAGSGDGLGTSVAELARILDAIAARGVPAARVGLCLDTAHLWGAGVAIGTAPEVDELVDEVAARIGLERLVMIHLNDSKVAFASRADRHQHLGAGEIGSDGFARLLTHPRLAHVAYFLETPGMDDGYDALNMARARELAAGIRPGPLPREALEIRGSRAHAAGPA
jgi:deoxyribonuclease-4